MCGKCIWMAKKKKLSAVIDLRYARQQISSAKDKRNVGEIQRKKERNVWLSIIRKSFFHLTDVVYKDTCLPILLTNKNVYKKNLFTALWPVIARLRHHEVIAISVLCTWVSTIDSSHNLKF